MVRISALGWSSDLRNLPEMNFIQLYNYPDVSREYRYIMLRGMQKVPQKLFSMVQKARQRLQPSRQGRFVIAAVVYVVLVVVVPYSSVKVVPILFTKMYFSLPFVHCILWETIQQNLQNHLIITLLYFDTHLAQDNLCS